MTTWIKDAHIVSPDREIELGSLLIDDGRITAVIDDETTPEADTVIDAAGRIAMPGFIDIHSHGADRCDVCDDDLMFELICDTIHVCPDMLRLIFKRIAIERLMLITDSMAASWIDKGEVMLGALEVVVENGAARLKDGGALAGSALRFNQGLKNVAEITGLPLHQIVKATSWNQARSLGLDGFGKLEPGFHADVVLLEENFEVWKTFVGGEER